MYSGVYHVSVTGGRESYGAACVGHGRTLSAALGSLFLCVKVNLVRVFVRRTAVPGGRRVPCSEVRTPLVGGVVRVCAWPAHAMWVAKAVIRSRVGTVW